MNSSSKLFNKHSVDTAIKIQNDIYGILSYYYSILDDGGINSTDVPGGHGRILDNAWRGAEAYHFLMLCQRQSNG